MPVTEDEPLMGGDHLIYSGQIDELIEIAYTHQLVSATHHVFSIKEMDQSAKLHTAYVTFSSSFATPIGSPTHMLVYGPGGYRFSDFMRIGLLMNIIILAANILIVNIVYPLTPLP